MAAKNDHTHHLHQYASYNIIGLELKVSSNMTLAWAIGCQEITMPTENG